MCYNENYKGEMIYIAQQKLNIKKELLYRTNIRRIKWFMWYDKITKGKRIRRTKLNIKQLEWFRGVNKK